jgi:hypothetical protein
LNRRQEVKQSLLRQRENLDSVRERMEAELREDRQIHTEDDGRRKNSERIKKV